MVKIKSKKPLIRSVYLISISLIFCAFAVIFYFNSEIQKNYLRMQDDHLEVIIDGSNLKTLLSTQQIQLARFLEERRRSEIYYIQTTQQQISISLEQMQTIRFTEAESIEFERLIRTNNLINDQLEVLTKDLSIPDQQLQSTFISANSAINLAIVFIDRILDSKYEQYKNLRNENEIKSKISNMLNILGGLTALFASFFFYRFLSTKVTVLEDEGARDGLTHLYNKRSLEKYLKSLNINPQNDGETSIAVMDIDHFKKINDEYGHIFGDEIIKKVARIITSSIRPTDAAFRFGGEEFLVIFKNAKLEEAYKVCERIRKSIEAYEFTYHEHRVKVTISIGLASSNSQHDYKSAIALADQNLYASKNYGRNKTIF